MKTDSPLLCIVDDDTDHSRAMGDFLMSEDFRVVTFASANELLAQPENIGRFDLVISDINMPGVSGFELCRTLRASPQPVRLPVILITGNDPAMDQAKGLDAGADEFIGKPFKTRHLIAKIKSLLEIRAVEQQRRHELETSQGLNVELGRFLPPNVASRLAINETQAFLLPHRAEVTVLFVDLRRFTAFSEKVQPEEVLEVLSQYYTAVGTVAMKFKGTLGHLAGDGIMVFFNDPEPAPNHRELAVRMAIEAREALNAQKQIWQQRGYDIDFGIGLSEGISTIGKIGFEHFSQYSVVGNVANFASRLCHLAVDGQILISHRFLAQLTPGMCSVQSIGDVILKGIERTTSVFNVVAVSEKE